MVRVPRSLRRTAKVLTRKIVTFVDASIQAYGAVVYLLCEYEDGTLSCRLVASKSCPTEANHSAKAGIDGGDIGTSANAEYLLCCADTSKIGTFLLRQ